MNRYPRRLVLAFVVAMGCATVPPPPPPPPTPTPDNLHLRIVAKRDDGPASLYRGELCVRFTMRCAESDRVEPTSDAPFLQRCEPPAPSEQPWFYSRATPSVVWPRRCRTAIELYVDTQAAGCHPLNQRWYRVEAGRALRGESVDIELDCRSPSRVPRVDAAVDRATMSGG